MSQLRQMTRTEMHNEIQRLRNALEIQAGSIALMRADHLSALAAAKAEGHREGIEAVLLELQTVWHGATGSGNPDYTTGWRAAIEFAQGRIRAQNRIRAIGAEETKP